MSINLKLRNGSGPVINIKENLDAVFALVILIFSIYIRYSMIYYASADYNGFLIHWYEFIKSNGGFKAFASAFSDYTPLYLYMMAIATNFDDAPIVLIKTISIAFDYITAFFVLRIVKLKYGNNILILFFACMAVIYAPTVIMNGAAWAQCDIIYTCFLVASIYSVMKERNIPAFIYLGIAFSLKLQAVFLFPLFMVLYLKGRVKIKHFFIIPATYVVSIIPSWIAGRPLMDLLLIYFKQKDTYRELTLNAPTLYKLLPNNYDVFSNSGLVLTAAIVLAICYLIYKSPKAMDKEMILKVSALFAIIVPYFLPQMHERYFFLADVVTIILAFYFPRYFYFPLVLSAVSFFSYCPFLFGGEIVDFRLLSVAVLILIVKLVVDLVKELYAVDETDKVKVHSGTSKV